VSAIDNWRAGVRTEAEFRARVAELEAKLAAPIPMILHCPECSERHIDEGEFATRVHATHACQHCGTCWRPAIEPTVGVWFLPGLKNTGDPPRVPPG